MIGIKLRQPALSSRSRFTARFCHEVNREFRYHILAEGITRKLLFRPTASSSNTHLSQRATPFLTTPLPCPPAPHLLFILCSSCAVVEYLRAAGTCSPKCAVKILDTILPFVLRDLRINLRRLRRAEKNASALRYSRELVNIYVCAWNCISARSRERVCTCATVPSGFLPSYSSFSSFCHPYEHWQARRTTPGALPTDVPSINHNIRINILRASFVLRCSTAPPLLAVNRTDNQWNVKQKTKSLKKIQQIIYLLLSVLESELNNYIYFLVLLASRIRKL